MLGYERENKEGNLGVFSLNLISESFCALVGNFLSSQKFEDEILQKTKGNKSVQN